MNAPLRLRDEGSADERLLLRAADGDGISPTAKRRLAATLGIGASIGATAGAAAATAATSKSTFLLVLKWLCVVGIPAAVVVGVLRSREVRPNPPPPPEVSAAPVVAPPAASTEPAPAPESSAAAAAESAEPPRPPASAPRVASLAEEVAALEAARSAVGRHDPGAALVAIDRYERDFPRRTLGPEATMLRVEALVQQGNRAAAGAVAKRLLRTSRAYEARIHTLLPELTP